MRDCGTHCEYVATWVDDLLYVGYDSAAYFQSLRDLGYKLKGVQMPEYHLGGDFRRVSDPENVLIWGSHTYVKKMLAQYEQIFGEMPPKREIHAPLEPGDHPELDTSPLCDAQQVRQYYSLIGALQWAVSLGRIDIQCATMCLGGFRAAPRIGHLNHAKRVFMYLRNYKKTSIKFCTEIPDYSAYVYHKPNFGHVYHPCKEEIPSDAYACSQRASLFSQPTLSGKKNKKNNILIIKNKCPF